MSRTRNKPRRSRKNTKAPPCQAASQNSPKQKLVKLLSEAAELTRQGLLEEAGTILTKSANHLTNSLDFDKDDAALWHNFAKHLVMTGETQQLLDLMPKMIEVRPWDAKLHSHLLFILHHLPDLAPQMILQEHKRWARIHTPASHPRTSHSNIPEPNRKLRIGYISPDFRTHPVAFFFESVLDGHDGEKVETYGYGNVADPDCVTQRLKHKFDHYRNIYGLDDAEAIHLIEQDKIDILVDLAGHTNNHRLGVLSYKPAPVQVTYLGYPGTTGVTAVDYRLSDNLTNPPESHKFYTEELLCLGEVFTCYRPPESAPAVTPLPADEKGYITFGSFKNNCKINPQLIALWAEVLKATENSQLLLRFERGDDEAIQSHYHRQFERFGIAGDRVRISGWRPFDEHLQFYGQVDIALDTWPFNGHTTTCHALWMGVPVISLVGQSHASRIGLSILNSIAMEFFAASNPGEYVAKAAALAQNRQSLAKIRATMRQRMAATTLCNPKKFTEELELLFRKIWRRWCDTHNSNPAGHRPQTTAKQSGSGKVHLSTHQAEPVVLPAEAPRQYKAKRGVLYVVWGNNERIDSALKRSIASVKQHHPELTIHVERLAEGGKINKIRACTLAPFEQTLFLDNETVVLGKLDYGFEKAEKFGLACCINECPWARRYTDKDLSGDMIEYNSGVLFFTEKAAPVFDAWKRLFPTLDSSIIHYDHTGPCIMPVADQGSFALAIEQTGLAPFVLPHNWNLRPRWHKSFFGPIKIWHSYKDVPADLVEWNKNQSSANSIIRYSNLTTTAKSKTKPPEPVNA